MLPHEPHNSPSLSSEQDSDVRVSTIFGTDSEAAMPVTPRPVSNANSPQDWTIQDAAPIVLVLTFATFLNTLSAQSVVIILPSISRQLQIPETRQQWIVSAFTLTAGSFLLLCGKLADVYGKRLLFILGCFWIAATNLGAAFSRDEICLYIMRALQGLGSAVTVPTAMGILGYTIPPGRVKNYAFAFYTGGAPIGQVVGNLLGGLIGEYQSWTVVFFVTAAIAFLAGTIAFFVIPKESPRDIFEKISYASQVDWIGAFLFTSGTLLLLFSLSEGVSLTWKTPLVLATLIVSVLLLIFFLFWQHHLETSSRDPLMRISIFKIGRFSAAMFIVFVFTAGWTNFMVYSTFYYQDYKLLSPLQTTIRFIPLGVTGIFATMVSGYLLSRIRGNYILMFGLVCGSICNLIFALPISPSIPYIATGFPAMILGALGADTVYPCLGLFTTQSLPRKDQGVAGAMFQTIAGLGRSMLLPVASTIQWHVQNSDAGESETYIGSMAYLKGLRAVEWFCAGCMLISLLVTAVGLRNMGKIGALKKLGCVQSAQKNNHSAKGEDSA